MNRVLGIDLGSRFVKVVLFVSNEINKSDIIDTAVFYRNYSKNINGKLEIDFERLKEKLNIEFEIVVSTGYGRNNLNIANSKIIQELKAHTLGAVWQTKLRDFTLLDIGGQDSKAIMVKNGKIVDIELNDKCAASCGRYLENMANILGLRVDDMAKYYKNPVVLNSTCAVFSESELISKISEGYKVEELIAGVNYSLFMRVKNLVSKFENINLILTGGVAFNMGIVNLIKEDLNFENVIIPKEVQINGAIGCCVYGSGSNINFKNK